MLNKDNRENREKQEKQENRENTEKKGVNGCVQNQFENRDESHGPKALFSN